MGHYNLLDTYLARNCLPPFEEGKGKLFRQFSDHVEVVENMSKTLEFDDNKSEKLAFSTSKIVDQVSQFQLDIYRKSEWRFDDDDLKRNFNQHKKAILARGERDRKSLMEHMRQVGTVGTYEEGK